MDGDLAFPYDPDKTSYVPTRSIGFSVALVRFTRDADDPVELEASMGDEISYWFEIDGQDNTLTSWALHFDESSREGLHVFAVRIETTMGLDIFSDAPPDEEELAAIEEHGPFAVHGVWARTSWSDVPCSECGRPGSEHLGPWAQCPTDAPVSA